MPLGDVCKHAEGQSVDHHQRPIGQRLGHAPGLRQCGGVGRRKAVAQRMDVDLPVQRPQAVDDAAVVRIAARAGLQVAWHEKVAMVGQRGLAGSAAS